MINITTFTIVSLKCIRRGSMYRSFIGSPLSLGSVVSSPWVRIGDMGSPHVTYSKTIVRTFYGI